MSKYIMIHLYWKGFEVSAGEYDQERDFSSTNLKDGLLPLILVSLQRLEHLPCLRLTDIGLFNTGSRAVSNHQWKNWPD